jgi:hypothetical protein
MTKPTNPPPPQQQPTIATASYEVQLAVYDLSHGMARNLSAQFLGPQHAIEIIPHTALLVFGREYYFGGGIQSVLPHEFRRSTGMMPIQILSLGHTRVSPAQFDQWCLDMMQQHGRYHAAAYDLLQRNCNHFCHDAALQGLQLNQGVPTWILDVPRRFLASPMGQLVRPMLEQMQVTAPSIPTPASSTTPVESSVGRATGAVPQLYHSNNNNNNTANNDITTNTTASRNIDQTNPWAQVEPSTTPTPTTSLTSIAAAPPTSVKTPLLDSFHAPLLSADTKTVGICISKLTAAMIGNGTNGDEAIHKSALESIETVLSKGQTPTALALENACAAVLSVLQQQPSRTESTTTPSSTTITFALMFLRLLVLHPPTTSGCITNSNSSWHDCLTWVQNELFGSSTGTTSPGGRLTTPAAKAMAWCVLSNHVGALVASSSTIITTTMSLACFHTDNNNDWLEVALADWLPESQPHVEVRQAAAAFFYNLVLLEARQRLESSSKNGKQNIHKEEEEEELSDLQVSLLCAALTNVSDETNSTTCLRRLMVAARLVKPRSTMSPSSAAAIRLIRDCEFNSVLRDLIAVSNGNNTNVNDSGKCHTLAMELLSIVDES